MWSSTTQVRPESGNPNSRDSVRRSEWRFWITHRRLPYSPRSATLPPPASRSGCDRLFTPVKSAFQRVTGANRIVQWHPERTADLPGFYNPASTNRNNIVTHSGSLLPTIQIELVEGPPSIPLSTSDATSLFAHHLTTTCLCPNNLAREQTRLTALPAVPPSTNPKSDLGKISAELRWIPPGVAIRYESSKEHSLPPTTTEIIMYSTRFCTVFLEKARTPPTTYS